MNDPARDSKPRPGRLRGRNEVLERGLAWRGAQRLPLATLLLAAVALGVSVWPGAAAVLSWDRVAVSAGQVWRLIGGHLVHFGPEHLAYDVLALLILGTVCERRDRVSMLWTLALSAVAIPVMVGLTRPDLATYRGLSGLDSGLFALLLTGLALQGRRATVRGFGLGVLAALFVAKLAVEATGSTVFVSPDVFVPVPVAHATGAAVGVVVGIVFGVGGVFTGARELRRGVLRTTARGANPLAQRTVPADTEGTPGRSSGGLHAARETQSETLRGHHGDRPGSHGGRFGPDAPGQGHPSSEGERDRRGLHRGPRGQRLLRLRAHRDR